MGYDTIVLGVGGMGSAACHQLAKRGARVLGLEQFELAHAQGSSHGETRLIRQAYFEEPRYVPLLKRAYRLWEELENDSGRRIFHRNGLLILGRPNHGLAMQGLEAAAAAHAIPIEKLEGESLRREFPQFRSPPDAIGVFESGAGYLEVERAVETQAQLARKFGAELRFGETVRGWKADPREVAVTTDRGTYRAARLLITAGPWTASVLADLGLPLHVLRVPLFWFRASALPKGPRPMPCFAFDGEDAFIYGFPPLGRGLKIADYHPLEEPVADPHRVDRKLYPKDLTRLKACIAAGLPNVDPEPIDSTVCLYTMTPDRNFILDRHPQYDRVVFAAGFSGHGFKFAPVIGEILADLSEKNQTPLHIGFLRLRWPKVEIN